MSARGQAEPRGLVKSRRIYQSSRAMSPACCIAVRRPYPIHTLSQTCKSLWIAPVHGNRDPSACTQSHRSHRLRNRCFAWKALHSPGLFWWRTSSGLRHCFLLRQAQGKRCIWGPASNLSCSFCNEPKTRRSWAWGLLAGAQLEISSLSSDGSASWRYNPYSLDLNYYNIC